MKTTIGGDRLGSGNKQEVSMRNYNRSSHDLGYTWRSSMAAGTLVPFMKKLALPGDSWDINLQASVLTLPTIGPLFGSYKVQLDVFQVPVRLYNARLHMNEIGIGLKMSDVKLPLVAVNAIVGAVDENAQVSTSALLRYLGISGVGRGLTTPGFTTGRSFNAVPFLAYWEIFKQYYANLQEDDAYCIHTDDTNLGFKPTAAILKGVFGAVTNVFGEDNEFTGQLNESNELIISFGVGTDEPNPATLAIWYNSVVFLDTAFDTIVWNAEKGELSCTDPLIAGAPTDTLFIYEDNEAQPLNISFTQAIRLTTFPLKNIDDMRKAILRWDQDTVAFRVDNIVGLETPYGLHKNTIDIDGVDYFSAAGQQEQLALKTYQSDLFNNWISTEWIDGVNGINEITSVDTTGDSFTIDALNLASKVYVMLNRIAISGGSYDDWLDAVYTHERTKSVENPVYMGSLIKELAFQEVVSNAQAVGADGESQPLGQLAGRGKLTQKNKGGQINIKTNEVSYIIGIASITPRVDYSQGNDWDVNLQTMDDFHKPALDAIGYQDLITEQMHWASTINTPDFTQYSAGKQPAWINYMTSVNKCYGNFASINKDMYMTLNRRYEVSQVNGIEDMTTYVDPSKFNFVFAQTDLSSQNFWVQISNNITARRKMSAKVIPNL